MLCLLYQALHKITKRLWSVVVLITEIVRYRGQMRSFVTSGTIFLKTFPASD